MVRRSVEHSTLSEKLPVDLWSNHEQEWKHVGQNSLRQRRDLSPGLLNVFPSSYYQALEQRGLAPHRFFCPLMCMSTYYNVPLMLSSAFYLSMLFTKEAI